MAMDDSILPTANAHATGHGNGHEPHGLVRGESSPDAVHDFFACDEDEGKPNKSREDCARMHAASTIQSVAMRHLISLDSHGEPIPGLSRKALLGRLELEIVMKRGLMRLCLSLFLFSLIVYSAVHESTAPARLGLLQTFRSIFSLDDSLADIKTMADFKDFLGTVSAQSRILQPLSSDYFSEHDGEVKLFKGFSGFDAPMPLNVKDLKAKIDTPEWTMTAWVQLETDGGAVIVRKPLGKSKEEQALSCWSWYVGWPYDKFEYGAHDFGGGKYVTAVQESVISPNASTVDDGKVHHVAVVVLSTKMQFWVDAEMTHETTLPRPITDCAGQAIEIGSADVPQLGEIIFYPHKMEQVHFKEILFAGFTLEAINEGKVPYLPKMDQSDIIIQKTSSEFADAHSERIESDAALKLESTLSRAAVELAVKPPNVTAEPKIAVANVANCPSIPIFKSTGHDDTSCHIIDTWDAPESDSLNSGRQYYNMLPSMARPTGSGAKDRLVIDHLTPKEYLRYDATAWPSFCGESATFSLWLETDTVHGGALLSRYSAADSHNHSELEYALYAEGYGLCVKGKRAKSKHRVPAALGTPLELMKHMSRRHVAYVFNKTTDETLTYLDGTLLGTTKHAAGTIAQLDCGLTGSTAYTGLGHLAPGVWGLKGPLQDWRYYKGHALTAAEIYKLAEDKTGPAVRTCEHHSEGGDSTWTDIYGHDCAWYYEMNHKTPGVCASAEARKQCPEACGVKKPCYEAHPHDTTFQLWNRIMKLEDSLHHKGMGLVCARSGVDVVDLCKKSKQQQRRGATSTAATGFSGTGTPPGAQSTAIPADGSAYEKSYMDIKLTDCEVLKKVVDPYCAFGAARTDRRGASTGSTAAAVSSAATSFGPEVHKEVKAKGGYTIEFWVKIDAKTRIPTNNEDYKAQPTSMRRIVFLSKVSPPQVMATIELRTDFNDIEFTAYGNCKTANVATISVDFPKADPLVAGVWNKVSMIYGATNEHDKRGIRIMRGSQCAFQFMDEIDWCESADDFLQAIQLPGGIMISPVEITLKPLPTKELQERFYQHKSKVQVRRGPAVVDKKRKTGTIDYGREAYNYPVALMAPPILLQKRVQKTPNCSTLAGTDFTQTLWNHTVYGEKCHFPYDCGSDLASDPTELMTCKTTDEPTKFFGAHKLGAELGHMHGLFFEFLQTISDAEVLLRIDQRRRGLYLGAVQDGVPLTRAPIRRATGGGGGSSGGSSGSSGTASAVAAGGASTSSASSSSSTGGSSGSSKTTPSFSQSLSGAVAFYPSEYLDFETEKVEVLLAAFSPHYGIASLITITAKITSEVEVDYFVDHYQATEGGKLHTYFVLGGLAILFSIFILIERSVTLYRMGEDWRDGLKLFGFDVALQVLMPIIWFGMRMKQLADSGYLVDHTVGHYGLAGIPWQDNNVLLEDKVSDFLSLLHHFEDEIDLEKNMSTFYFVLVTVSLFRLIAITEFHPRLAILVKTLKGGLDDTLHFLILFCIVLGGYIVLGMAQFGHFKPEFRDFDSSFRSLWEMQLGGMLPSGATPSQYWSSHPALSFFQMTYMIFLFFILFNFIIAIIVEAYMKVTQEIQEDDSEQAIWTDVADTVRLSYLTQIYRWPPHKQLIDHLEKCKKMTVGYEDVRRLIPQWREQLYVRRENTLRAWLIHYNQYEFLRPGQASEEPTELEEFRGWLHTELSVMLGVPQPTEFEKVLEKKRLDVMAYRERMRRGGVQAGLLSSSAAAASETAQRKQAKHRRLLSLPIPSSVVVRDVSHLRPQHATGPPLDQVPAWVEEEVGPVLAASMAGKIANLKIDEPLLRFFDHDSWKKLGVDDGIVRCRLLRRQLEVAAEVLDPPVLPGSISEEWAKDLRAHGGLGASKGSSPVPVSPPALPGSLSEEWAKDSRAHGGLGASNGSSPAPVSLHARAASPTVNEILQVYEWNLERRNGKFGGASWCH